jgi:uncharacterized protein
MSQKSMSVEQIAAENQRYIVKVYGWMCLAMILTGGVALYTAKSNQISDLIHAQPWIFFGLVILQFTAVGILVKVINKMNAWIATILFFLYSFFFGVTLSFIFKVYTSESIASTFFITAVTFGIMTIYGFFTKTDLTRMGNMIFMVFIGLAIASVVNYYIIESSVLYWITTTVGVLLFIALTAYDTQKIKNANIIGNEGSEEDHKESIIGALTLYLDFIYMFLYLLQIFGRRR